MTDPKAKPAPVLSEDELAEATDFARTIVEAGQYTESFKVLARGFLQLKREVEGNEEERARRRPGLWIALNAYLATKPGAGEEGLMQKPSEEEFAHLERWAAARTGGYCDEEAELSSGLSPDGRNHDDAMARALCYLLAERKLLRAVARDAKSYAESKHASYWQQTSASLADLEAFYREHGGAP